MTEPSGLPSHVRQRIALDSDSGCWHWIGGCNPDGYGTVRSKEAGKNVRLHNLTYDFPPDAALVADDRTDPA